jgi:hypothetical protein
MMRKLLSTIFCLGVLNGFTQNTIALPEIVRFIMQAHKTGKLFRIKKALFTLPMMKAC